MYVPWIHGNAPVPEWWKKLRRWAAEDPTGNGRAWHTALLAKWDRERAELDAAIAEMPPMVLKTEGWTGYDVDALQPFDEEP